ncbi:MAG: DUF4037 domain-containing protein [Anaerolineaceae bacterium]|nr:DUF4037 domain-containing protein [Anaerolineaceae bacterium]
MPEFIQGAELCRRFYDECVHTILSEYYPALNYSAGLSGFGSEVLGFDTPMSRDHDWGPRMQLFLTIKDGKQYGKEIDELLSRKLPYEFYGYSTHFGLPDESDNGTRKLEKINTGFVSHRVVVTSLEAYLQDYFPVEVMGEISEADWLVIPQQKLRSIVDGAVFYDGLNILKPFQEKLRWYPESVWIYLMASAWSRIGQEEHLMGRCGTVGDEIGSYLLGASLTRILMQLTFLMEKIYTPYTKWFGTAFRELKLAASLYPAFEEVRIARTWQERQDGLVKAYLVLVRQMNSMKMIEPVNAEAVDFFGRPFKVVYAGKIAESLQKLLKDTPLANMPLIGNIDIVTSSTDVVENNTICHQFGSFYKSLM